MKKSSYIRNDKGIALVAALIVMLLLLVLGAAAMQMSTLGFTSISAEKKYQLANWAAEHAVQVGIDTVVSNALCPADNAAVPVTSPNGTARYFRVPDSGDTYCFIHATGQQGTAKVNKTVVVPRAGSDWGAMVAKSCNINLSGSSGIAGCDDDESGYADRCGVLSALIHDGAIVNSNAVPETITQCKAEGTIKGLDGNPPEIRSPKTFEDELVKKYFQVTDEDSSGSAWDDLLEKIETHYSNLITSGVWRKIEFFDQNKIAQKFGLPQNTLIAPGTVPNQCIYNSNSPNKCCKTSIVGGISYIECYGNATCTGTAPTIACDGQQATSHCRIDLSNCKQTQTVANEVNYPYIAKDDDTVAFVSINAPLLRVTTSGHRIALVSNNPVDITSAINNTRIYTGGDVEINAALSATNGNPGSIIYAGGNVTIAANVGNHGADSCNAATLNIDPMLSSTHIISGGEVNIGTQDIKNTNIFANVINIQNKPDIQGGYAKVLYALNRININTNGSPCIGYPCGNDNNLHPLLFLVGDGNPVTTGSSFSVSGTGGNLTMDGMLFTDAITMEMTGAVEFQGTIINISNTCEIETTGNAVIQFNKRILDGVFNQLCGGIMQPVRCGGGNKADYISNTKTTLY